MENLLFGDITRKILYCAFEVHKEMGCGFQEVIYQRALAIEMQNASLVFSRELEQALFYKKQEIGKRRVDFVVEEDVLVELKAVGVLEDVHINQTLNYLKAYGKKVGLLINFGAKSLQFKRLVL